MIWNLFWLFVSAAVLVVTGWGLHRFALLLEARGYIYYREKPQSGSGYSIAANELDQLIRPSIEHVAAAREETRLPRKTDNGTDVH